jgi:hypothetical protein
MEKNPFVLDTSDRLLVPVKLCGLPPIIVHADMLPQVCFADEPTAYIEVAQVRDWYKRELLVPGISTRERKMYERRVKELEELLAMAARQVKIENEARST